MWDEDSQKKVSVAYALELIRHAANILEASGVNVKTINIIRIGVAGVLKQIREGKVQ